MSLRFCLLEPWTAVRNAEFLSLDATTGNLRVRVAGMEQTYLATSFRFNGVQLPLDAVSLLGLPGGVISIARVHDAWPEALGMAGGPTRDLHAGRLGGREIVDGQGNLEGELASERAEQDRQPQRHRAREQPSEG